MVSQLQRDFGFDLRPLFLGPPGAQWGIAVLLCPVMSPGPFSHLWAPLIPWLGRNHQTHLHGLKLWHAGGPALLGALSSLALGSLGWPSPVAPCVSALRPSAGSATPGKCLLQGSFQRLVWSRLVFADTREHGAVTAWGPCHLSGLGESVSVLSPKQAPGRVREPAETHILLGSPPWMLEQPCFPRAWGSF